MSISLNCENGASITLNEIMFTEIEFSAKAIVKSDWFEATISFRAEQNRLTDFLEEIESIISDNNKKANFINNDGNFDIEIIYDTITGKVNINGILIKDMMDDSRLEFSMETDYFSLEKLKEDLNQILNGDN